MDKVIVYGMGDFFKENKDCVYNSYDVVGIIDRNKIYYEKNIYESFESIDMINVKYDYILVMISKAEYIFEVIHKLIEKIDCNKIILGIAKYGTYSNCDDITVEKNGQIKILCGKAGEAWNPIQFYEIMKELLIPKIRKENDLLEHKLMQNYADFTAILWSGNQPLSHDHDADLYYRFPKMGIWDWGEIATFNLRAIHQFEKAYVLDLGCSDGFYYKRFYSYIDQLVYWGIDFDEKTIQKAQKANNDLNNKFFCQDFCKDFPEPDHSIGYYTNIIWNSSIQMFHDEDINIVLQNIKLTLSHEGILSGTATLKTDFIESGWKYCINPFDSVEDLKTLLKKYFKNIFVYNDKGMPGRIMFMASDSGLPFYTDK